MLAVQWLVFWVGYQINKSDQVNILRRQGRWRHYRINETRNVFSTMCQREDKLMIKHLEYPLLTSIKIASLYIKLTKINRVRHKVSLFRINVLELVNPGHVYQRGKSGGSVRGEQCHVINGVEVYCKPGGGGGSDV